MKKHVLHLLLVVFGLTALVSCKKDPRPPVAEPPQKTFYAWDQFAMGADLSYVNQVQDHGGVYRDSGAVTDPFVIFKKYGANVVRVRLWHNPSLWQAPLNNGRIYNDLAEVEKTIQRAKSAGLAVSLDLHYSDRWADPGQQETPAAWSGLPLSLLQDSVYQYTLRVLNHLKSRNLTPELIQIGNETNQGMLFPVGKAVNNNWTAFAGLLNQGIRAVRDFSAAATIKPQVILHVAQYKNAAYFAGQLQQNGVTDYDILGISHYDIWSEGYDLTEIENTTRSLKLTYGKKIMVVETACPWTSQGADNYTNIISGATRFAGFEVSAAGQLDYLKALTQSVIKGGGSGMMYWEPAWITSSLRDLYGTGSSWENMALFDFSGNALPGLDYMGYGYKF